MDTLASRPARRGRPRRIPIDDVVENIAPEPIVAPQFDARPSLRPEMREIDPRSAADIRAAEIMNNLGQVESGVDKFFIPTGEVPDGWDYNWKRKTIYNQEDPAYQVSVARGGWTAVPVSRHSAMMPGNWKGMSIERDGMILMERPMSVTDHVRRLDRQRARDQVRAKEQQLSATPQGTMEQEFSDPRTKPRINKSFEAMPVPADK